MTAMLAGGGDMATSLLRLGTKNFISKPFSDNGWKLSQTDRSVLSTSENVPEVRNHVSWVAELPSPYIEPKGTSGEFVGGELNIEKNRITLCGHTESATSLSARMVRSSGVSTIARPWASGWPRVTENWHRRSKSRLATKSVACSIHSFPRRITDILRTEFGLKSDNKSVISGGGSGCRFNKWIAVRDARQAKLEVVQVKALPPSRRERILSLLQDTENLCSVDTATELGCRPRNVKRKFDSSAIGRVG